MKSKYLLFNKFPSLYLLCIELRTKFISIVYSDEKFVCKHYQKTMGRKLDLKKPKSFNEKIQWFKINWEDTLATQCADKYLARDFVKARGCGKYLNDILGVYTNVNEIDFHWLPKKFVLKATHASGWNLICTNKQELSWPAALKIMAFWLHNNYYNLWRERLYKSIKPRVVCERFIEDSNGNIPHDYKIWCFDGNPAYIEVDANRMKGHQQDFYDLDWNKLPFKSQYPYITQPPQEPERLDEMLEVARKLSQGFQFVRVDMYCVQGRVYFGEMTFFPAAGCKQFGSYDYDVQVGDKLSISQLRG